MNSKRSVSNPLRRRVAAAFLSASLVAGTAAVAMPAEPASAACKGSNGRKAVGAGGGGMNPVDKYEVKMDSCAASKLVDGFENFGSATSFIGAAGSKWWPVSFSMSPFIAWAWKNKSAVKNCEKPGTGIKFTETNGIITNCKAQ